MGAIWPSGHQDLWEPFGLVAPQDLWEPFGPGAPQDLWEVFGPVAPAYFQALTYHCMGEFSIDIEKEMVLAINFVFPPEVETWWYLLAVYGNTRKRMRVSPCAHIAPCLFLGRM